MNILYDILSEIGNLKDISSGMDIEVDIDVALAHDKSMGNIMKLAEESNSTEKREFWNKLYVTVDHFLPAPTGEKREEFLKIKRFSRKKGINLFQHGEGIMHQVLAENFQYDLLNKVVVGVDGHVCTAGGLGAIPFSISAGDMIKVMELGKYKFTIPEVVKVEVNDDDNRENISGKDIALSIIKEVTGKVIKNRGMLLCGEYLNSLTKSQKMTIGNMLGEMGAKTVYFSNNKERVKDEYHKVFTLEKSHIGEMISLPGSPENIKVVDEVKGTPITEVFIGGCTNGRIDDMKEVAEILKGKNVHPEVTLIICPASRKVANEMDRLHISESIRNSGGIIINPGCGACGGVHQGVLSKDDVIVSTTVRNTPGRMGDERAKIYLASPKVAAIASIQGKI